MISALPSLLEAGRLVRAKGLSPVELVEFCLAQIRRLDERVRAWVLVDESGARGAAEECARAIRAGSYLGALHGIPIGIKDIIDVQGLPTKAGSPLREKHMAQHSAALVARLRQCGAIILGKTVTTQFACFDPPPTRNPWNLAHTPGGSSSGSAAAVASQMCPLAFGTQTGGSIIRPASFCGVSGLKPRYGAVSLQGVVPLAWHLDHAGPLARTAADLREFWFEFYDKTPRLEPELAPLEALFRGARPTLLRLDGFCWEAGDGDVRQAAESALATLERAGASVESLRSIKPPLLTADDMEEILKNQLCINAVEAAEYHRQDFATQREAFAPKIAWLIEMGLAASVLDYAAALRRREEFRRQFVRLKHMLPDSKPLPVMVTPATATPAPGAETTGDPKFNAPWSYLGLATVTIPCGLAPNGLPCGLQLIGFDDEASLLDVAAWCEEKLCFQAAPPILQGD